MKRQIYSSIFLTSVVSTLLMSVLIFFVMYGQFYNEVKKSVKKEAAVIKTGYTLSGAPFLEELKGETYRITLIKADGTVLYDSVADAASMENHIDRPEVRKALESGTGEADRASETIDKWTYYHAERLSDGNVIRVASTTDSVYSSVWSCLPYSVLGIALIAVLSAVTADKRTKRIIRPINELNLDRPFQNEVYEELTPLLSRIEKQYREIKLKADELQGKQDEFSAITGSMSEGLILVNSGGLIISMNQSAARLYGADRNYTGLDLLAVDRSARLRQIMDDALHGKTSDAVREISGRQYQYLANPVLSAGRVQGAVLLIIDITERQRAEQLRREFTANVSHELKTPLQSIIGSAELLKSGLVKSEDAPRFTERIYNEARHLVNMVDDIIRLSQLDELKGELPKEDIDLTALAGEVAGRLSDIARERGVSIAVRGTSVHVQSVHRLLWEIVYNLCDNAVKYNRTGGAVDITVSDREGSVELTVSDTGIGIPREDQSRVFERFYRVDKSHSRDTGGTGLGLSIVKHAAQYLGLTIRLKSVLGEGTEISVLFPCNDFPHK
jgi:two-component system phosphate regulon sensor histidine kinase PhoR